MMHSSDAYESNAQAGYVLVPVNDNTRSFLSRFTDIPIPSVSQKKPKKRTPSDDLSASFGFPVNKKRGGLLADPEPKTNKLKSPYSFDAGCTIAVPRNKAATIARVRGSGLMQPRTNILTPPYSFDAGCTIAVPRNKAATIVRVPGARLRDCVSFVKGRRTNNNLKSPDSFDAGCTAGAVATLRNKAATIARVPGFRLMQPRTKNLKSPYSFDAGCTGVAMSRNKVARISHVQGCGFRPNSHQTPLLKSRFSFDEDDTSIEEDSNPLGPNQDSYDEEVYNVFASADADGDDDDDDDDDQEGFNHFNHNINDDNDETANDDDNPDDEESHTVCDSDDSESEDNDDNDDDYEDDDCDSDNNSDRNATSRTAHLLSSFGTYVSSSSNSNSSNVSSSTSQNKYNNNDDTTESAGSFITNDDDNSESGFSLCNDENSSKVAAYPLPIVLSLPRPAFATQTLPNYNYKASSAPSPVRDSIVTYETMDTRVDLSLNITEPFATAGIVSLQSFVKRGRGMAWQNRSSSKLHYETDLEYFKEHTKPKATLLRIPHHIYYPEGNEVRRVVTGTDNVFVIVSGGTFDEFHDKVCFQDLIRDACIPAKNTIPLQDKLRRNSGPSVGLSSSQGTTRTSKQAYAVPNFVPGTARYSKVFGIASETTRLLLSSCGLSSFLPPTGSSRSPKQLSYQRRCEELCMGNLYLGLSFKLYVHHPSDVDNHQGHFQAHRDANNPDYNSPNDMLFTAWETWFEPMLNLYVTGTIILCGRRSQEELYNRIFKIGRATDEILSRSLSVSVAQRTIHPEMLCPPGFEFVTQGCHLLQIHALTPNEYIYQLSKHLGCNQGLSAFLATEIILGYHQTSNNALRFHRYMHLLLDSVKQHHDLRYLGQLNLIESYQKYCYATYGGFEGTTNKNGVREGVVRHQPSVSSPISHYENRRSLRDLVMLLETKGKVSSCTQRQYDSLVKQLKDKVHGLGDLKAQKAVMTFASMGLFIDKHYLSFFSTGSPQQLKNLASEPFQFTRADEIKQLRHNLCVRLPHLLPMQADEYICTLTSAKKTSRKKTAQEEKVGEVYYCKQSIFNARLENGTITLHRFSWSRKENEPAPCIVFNYSRVDNHYIPTWAEEADSDIGSNVVSLCSNKNMTNVPKQKLSTHALDFHMSRDITPDDFQKLLSAGLYIVVPELVTEVLEYLQCEATDLSKSIRIRRASHRRGHTCDVDMSQLCNSSTKNIFGSCFETLDQSKISALIQILVTVEIDGKSPWPDKFFVGNLKGFLLLLPRSACESFCVVAAFIYINSAGTFSCCVLDERGNAAATHQSGY